MVSDVIPFSRTSYNNFVDGGAGNMISDWSWVIYFFTFYKLHFTACTRTHDPAGLNVYDNVALYISI